ncbi:unnamed protein product [Choristocarpus tenellus]
MSQQGGRGSRGRGRGGHNRNNRGRKADAPPQPPPVTGKPNFDKLEREIGELVMSKTDCASEQLETLLANAQVSHLDDLDEILSRTTTRAFPQGSLLAAACESGKRDVAEQLLCYGADPEGCSPSGSTPLALACYNGRAGCVELLLGLPTTLQKGMVGGRTPPSPVSPRKTSSSCECHMLIHACRGNNEGSMKSVVELLIRADRGLVVEPDIQGGTTAIHEAASRGFPAVVRVLLESFENGPFLSEVGVAGGSQVNASRDDATIQRLLSMKNQGGRCPLQVKKKV